MSLNIIPDIALSSPVQFSSWCHSRAKRTMDILLAGAGVLLLWPVLVLVAVAVKLSSPGPALFRQKRVGRGGKKFEFLKFRTMTDNAFGPALTRSGDQRVTRLGRFLRATKLDELPQLWNVLRGDMSLVGPRPDLQQYLHRLGPEQLRVLDLYPGITGAASLRFRREEELLAGVPGQELTHFYCKELLPQKVALEIQYARKADWLNDLSLIARTAWTVLRH